MKHPLVLAITGASGAIYAVRLLSILLRSGCDVHATISPSGQVVLLQELGVHVHLDRFSAEDLTRTVGHRSEGPPSEMNDLTNTILDELADVLRNPAPQAGRLHYHHHADFMAPIASGSFLTRGMIVCPCSGSTLSAVVHGGSNNLVQRSADVHLKERRRLILVPRETPVSSIQLDNMKRACEAGAVVLPAMPGWYHGVRSLADLVDFIVARILDQLDIPHTLMKRWGVEEPS